MKAEIIINFKKINGKIVDEKLLKANPKLPNVTQDTINILCHQIKKYFQNNKIEVGVEFKLDGE